MSKLGQRIKALRKEKGMTQAELVGNRITRNQLSMIEKGTTNPSMETLAYIAERLEKPVSHLLNEEAFTFYECQTFIEQCSGAIKKGDYHSVIEKVEQFLEAIGGSGEFEFKDIVGRLYHLLGTAYFKVKDEKASIYLQDSLKYMDKVNSSWHYCNSLNLLSVMAYGRGDFEKSEELLLEANAMMGHKDDDGHLLKLDIMYNLAFFYVKQNKLAEGVRVIREALAYSDKFEVYRNYGQLNMLMSGIFRDSKKYDEAINCSNLALGYFGMKADEMNSHRCHINLGILYRLKGDYENSLKYLTLAETYFIRTAQAKPLIDLKAEKIKTFFFTSSEAEQIFSYINEIIDSPELSAKDRAEITAIMRILYTYKEKPEKSLIYLQACEKELDAFFDSEFKVYVYLALNKVYEKLEDMNMAYDYLNKFKHQNVKNSQPIYIDKIH